MTQVKKSLVPLSKVVKAAIVDTYEDIGKTQELYTHWAARGLRKLNREVLKTGVHHVLLKVNKGTNTAVLPCDFQSETFVGRINEYGVKIPLKKNTGIVNVLHLEDETVANKCDKCNQNKSICEDLKITEEVELVTINNEVYEKTTVKKLYPNGDYFLEVTTPLLDVTDLVTVSYFTEKTFVGKINLKPCGCLEPTASNISILKQYNPSLYYRYYARCASSCDSSDGGYKIFEEQGLIQFDRGYNLDYVYMEYRGFMPTVNGQYCVPEVAFETLVNWVKFKSVENKKSVSLSDRDWHFAQYDRERRNMVKDLGRISLSSILYAAIAIPKFDLPTSWYGGYYDYKKKSEDADSCSTSASTATPVKNVATYEINFRIGDAGYPSVGQNTFYSSALVGMTIMVYREGDLQYEGDTDSGYTFNVSTGTITFYPSFADEERISIRGYRNL
jgi:hypothetical protein